MRRYVCLLIYIGLITGMAAAQELEPFGLERKNRDGNALLRRLTLRGN